MGLDLQIAGADVNSDSSVAFNSFVHWGAHSSTLLKSKLIEHIFNMQVGQSCLSRLVKVLFNTDSEKIVKFTHILYSKSPSQSLFYLSRFLIFQQLQYHLHIQLINPAIVMCRQGSLGVCLHPISIICVCDA